MIVVVGDSRSTLGCAGRPAAGLSCSGAPELDVG
jgi:hypothetical protein